MEVAALIPLDQQMRLVALAKVVDTPYDLVSYNPIERRIEVWVSPEPQNPPALVAIDVIEAIFGRRPRWAPLVRSLVVTGPN